jgi:hypothetical protein
MAKTRLIDRLKNLNLDPAKIVSDMVLETADGAADIVDRFVTNPQEKQAALEALREFTLDEQREAFKKDQAILADRQSARGMASVHGKLQKTFALVFLIGFLALVVAEFAFVGLIVSWELKGTAPLSDWAKTLIASLLSGVLGYMVSMIKEITGFLFGGSAGGDDVAAQLGEAIKIGTEPKQSE